MWKWNFTYLVTYDTNNNYNYIGYKLFEGVLEALLWKNIIARVISNSQRTNENSLPLPLSYLLSVQVYCRLKCEKFSTKVLGSKVFDKYSKVEKETVSHIFQCIFFKCIMITILQTIMVMFYQLYIIILLCKIVTIHLKTLVDFLFFFFIL